MSQKLACRLSRLVGSMVLKEALRRLAPGAVPVGECGRRFLRHEVGIGCF